LSGRSPQLLRVLAIVVVLGLVGVLAGVVWEWVWNPPTGVVFRDRWVLQPSGPDLSFSATGWYVVVASLAGLVAAAVIGWLVRRDEVATLVGVALGSVVAGWLMLVVGHALGPADPQVLAAGKEDFTSLPSDLRVAGDDQPLLGLGSSAFVAFPSGALIGLGVVFLTSRGRDASSSSDDAGAALG
jgi:hypothetical protein